MDSVWDVHFSLKVLLVSYDFVLLRCVPSLFCMYL